MAREQISTGMLAPKRLHRRRKIDYKLFLMALPFVIFLIMFYYVQLFGWVYAFFDFKPGVSILSQKFIGLANFQRLFSPGSNFPLAFRNTLIYGLLGILTSPVPVAFAIMISELRSNTLSRVIQTITSFPNFISWILVYAVAFMIFSNDGFMNTALAKLGNQNPVNVLGNPRIAYVLQMLLGLWKGTGWCAIIYLAAISGIDHELYDAAAIDGANRFQRLFHITWQGIKPTFFILLVLNVSGLVSAGFDQYYVFFNPLVSDKLEVIATYVYRVGLGNGEYSFATAMGMFQSVISVILLFLVNFMAKKVTGSSIV